jgi:predicted phosphodiesterase
VELKFAFKKKRILFLSDIHAPYQHPDCLKFLKALKTKYKPHLVVSVGDLADFHDISFHKSDPKLPNATRELEALQTFSRDLEKLFPKMIITLGNHDSLPKRRLFDESMPESFLKPYNDIYGVGKGWQFVDDLTIKDGSEIIYVAHGITKDGRKLAAQRGVHVVQGHHHTECRIDFVSNPRNLLWSLQVGCLIDRNALAFAYDKLNLNRPIIATGLAIRGMPVIEPLILTDKHKWIGRLA